MCGGVGGEYILSLLTLALAGSCICMGKHAFGLHTINKSRESKIIIISTKSAFLKFLFQTFIVAKLDLFKVCLIHFIFH